MFYRVCLGLVQLENRLFLHARKMIKYHEYTIDISKCNMQRTSLAVVIVSLININNWPYLGINNFQLMNQIRTLALTSRVQLVGALQL